MSQHSVAELERSLQGNDAVGPGPDLAAIRSRGVARRRRRALAGGTAAVAAVVVLGMVTGGLRGYDTAHERNGEPPVSEPHHLSALAARALAQVPGARQVSDWQVVLPAPDDHVMWPSRVNDDDVQGAPIPTGAHHYTGVTSYRQGAWPAWLYQGVAAIEEDLGDDNGHPVGSTDMGILVDTGEAYLGCVGHAAESCAPAYLTRSDRGWTYEWGMGTDDFLKPGSDMEVFLSDDYASGSLEKLVYAGLPGTDVARAELVTTSGERLEGHVEAGTLVAGSTMVWGRVPGDLAAVIAYDASGDVIEDHRLKACSSPVDCEVR
jgi:hypothetical protein